MIENNDFHERAAKLGIILELKKETGHP